LTQHLVFVYGTLLAGEVNHYLLTGADVRGAHRTEPCYTMFGLGAYPGVVKGGSTAVSGEVYRVDAKDLERLDWLEGFPRLYGRVSISSRYGRPWMYLYRGRTKGRPVIASGNWRTLSANAGSLDAAIVRSARDPKNPRWSVVRAQP
jgi:gamma-glutamylaminecyclotransferase